MISVPSPTEPAFAKVGDVVENSQTLCLIEAMKLFRPVSLSTIDQQGELYSGQARYEIVRINAGNAQAVNEGDLLFVIKPVAA